MTDIVLWLGGNFARGNKVAEIALQNTSTTVLVSSESDARACHQFLLNTGLPRERFILNYDAWDTVSNFTKTWPIVERLKAQHVYVVTDGFHMKRAMAIANAVYCMRPVIAHACPCSPIGKGEPEHRVREDRLRAMTWRLTGYEPRWADVYEARMPYYREQAAIAAQL